MRLIKVIVFIVFLFISYYYISILLTGSYIQIERPSKENILNHNNSIYYNYELNIIDSKIYNDNFKNNFEIILDNYFVEKSYGMFYLFKHKKNIKNDIWIMFIMKNEINETLFKIKYDQNESKSLFGDRNGLKIPKNKKKCLVKILTNKNVEVCEILIKW